MSNANAVVKLLREIAVVRASKDLPEAMKESVIAEMKLKLGEAIGQKELPLSAPKK